MIRKKFKETRDYVRIGSIFITRYEKARIIGARALQISFGAPILISLKNITLDSLSIAAKELEKGVLPITIRRSMPSGDYQDVALSKLILEE
jgi:DNA-directed RNA polymerase I, II, and III subunit RPABC2